MAWSATIGLSPTSRLPSVPRVARSRFSRWPRECRVVRELVDSLLRHPKVFRDIDQAHVRTCRVMDGYASTDDQREESHGVHWGAGSISAPTEDENSHSPGQERERLHAGRNANER